MEKEKLPIEIYQSEDGSISLNVSVQDETVWLTQKAMAELFDVESNTITYHLKEIYRSNELTKESTTRKIRVVQTEGKREVERLIDFYNLDAIISVGYRVNSSRATQFRIWATKVLKDYILKGYSINQRIINNYDDLKNIVQLISRSIREAKNVDEYEALFDVAKDYVYALDTLDRYDYQSLTVDQTRGEETFRITYENAIEAINALRDKFGSSVFANEKDQSFRSSVGQIYQTFDGIDLYPSLEEKAAMLLYLVVKNHSFTDGNKRIAAMLFLWFLQKNGILYGEDGNKRIGDNTLVALTLMIAQSDPAEKDLMVKVVVNLINKNNK